MKPKSALILPALAAFTASAHAAVVIPITDFNPYTYFTPQHVGIDFDDSEGAPGSLVQTQPGFASIPQSNLKTYNVTTGGITFNWVVNSAANQNNVNRYRNELTRGGPLLNDFEQWFGNGHAAGAGVTATLTLTGLALNTEYDTSFFFANFSSSGTGASTLNDPTSPFTIYDGATTAAPVLDTFIPSGFFTGSAPNVDYTGFSPGITIGSNSGPTGTIVLTVRAGTDTGTESRLTLNGISVLAIPEPSSALLGGLGMLALLRRRR